MPKGTVSHFEIPVEKMDRAKKFYADAFDWKILTVPGGAPGQNYVMAQTAPTDEKGMIQEKGAINGGMVTMGH
jgi:predicted enzyme related to lactoylglutathione lyase